MANLIGGIPPLCGTNDHIDGTAVGDFIFGDPFTTGISFFFDVPEVGGTPSSGEGGKNTINGDAGKDSLIGDVQFMSGNARGGSRRLEQGSRPHRRCQELLKLA